jgi:hypothetical protein
MKRTEPIGNKYSPHLKSSCFLPEYDFDILLLHVNILTSPQTLKVFIL